MSVDLSTPRASTLPSSTQASESHVPSPIRDSSELPSVQHIPSKSSTLEDEHPDPSSPISNITRRLRFNKLRKRLFQERHLMQFFDHDTLYRVEGSRSVRSDELFLDLVIVGGLAALGHELRENFEEWADIEKFILLFYAFYSSWKTIVFLWNLWDVKGDLIDKFSIYFAFLFLTGVALGANGAFQDGIRPYVSVCAFLATAVPGMANVYWALREPLLRNKANLVNPAALVFTGSVVSVLPYLGAAFVPSERASRILFWIPIGLQSVLLYSSNLFFRVLHRNRPGYTRIALCAEHLVEKYEVLTMIVLGESVLGLLFEAARFITLDNAEVADVYICAIPPTLMLLCFQTLYVGVDNYIGKGSVHAIRQNVFRGVMWSNFHTLYHFALILFATGLGISIRDIVIPISSSDEAAAEAVIDAARAASQGAGGAVVDMARAVIRQEEEGEFVLIKVVEEFNREARWFFSIGWGSSVIISALLSATHFGGPRATTKKYRLSVRIIVAIGVMVGMPFANLSAGRTLAVYATVLFVITASEFILVQADRIGFLRSERGLISSAREAAIAYEEEHESSDEDDEQRPSEEVLIESKLDDNLRSALSERLHMKHRARLVAVEKPRRSRAGEYGGHEIENQMLATSEV